MLRPFETDYAGVWRGHCLSRENAILAAMRHIVQDDYTSCTITDKRNATVVARVRLSADRRQAVVDVPKPFATRLKSVA